MNAPSLQISMRTLLVVPLIVASIVWWFAPAFLIWGPPPHKVYIIEVEIRSLESGLAVFKAEYGFYPPSGLVLHRSRSEWDADPQSMRKVRQIWPQFDFDRCEGLEALPAGGVALNGAEALVFFLGGIRDSESGEFLGFSKNPTSPFCRTGPRESLLFEFDPKRLVDIDIDGYSEYCDVLGPDSFPMVYACKWEGRYSPADFQQFIRDVYRTGREADSEEWGRGGYQLISPGQDRKYGIGGYFSLSDPAWATFPQSRTDELDNRVSFARRELGEHR